MLVGWIQPIFQASRINRNSAMDNPTRKASALAILPLGRERPSSSAGPLPRIMMNKAAAKLPKIATKAKATTVFMGPIIR